MNAYPFQEIPCDQKGLEHQFIPRHFDKCGCTIYKCSFCITTTATYCKAHKTEPETFGE